MSYNGTGTFNINTAGQPVVTGTVISSTAFNALTADLATGLSTAITKDGQTTVTANIPFNNFKLTGIAAATATGDALSYGRAATVTTLVASTSITDSGLTSGRVTYAGTAGLLQDSANLTFDGTYLTANSIKNSALTSGRVTYAGASGLLSDSAGLTWDGTTFAASNVSTGGSVTLSGGTANGVLYLNGSKVATSGTALTFDGTNLSVVNAGSAAINVQSLQSYLQLRSTGAFNPFINFFSSTSTLEAQIQGVAGGAALVFATGASATEGMRLTSTGLGIGTSSPNFLSWNKAETLNTASGNAAYELGIGGAAQAYFAADGSNVYLAAYANKPLLIRTNNSTVATFDTSGNLGLGVTPGASNYSGSATVFNVKGNGANKIGTVIAQSYGSVYATNIELFASDGANEVGLLTKSASTAMTFWTGSSPTKQMTIDASGNLGLGVTPSAWGSGYKAIEIGNAGLSGVTATTYLTQNAYINSSSQYVYKSTALASVYYQNSGEHVWQTAPSGTAGNTISFTQAMTLDASGNLLVGNSVVDTSNAGWKVSPNTGGRTGYTNTLASSSESTNTYSCHDMYSSGAGNYRFYVGWGGTVYATNTTISAISDQRFKENVRDLDAGLTEVLALKPRKFDWKTGKGKGIKGDRGFIAQEFEQVFPDLIDEWKDPAPEGEEPYKSVRQDLIPVLVKAIQELKAEIDNLKTQLKGK